MDDILRRRLLYLVPAGIAFAGGAGFWAMLQGLRTGSYDPRAPGSPQLGRPAPAVSLPPIPDWNRPGLDAARLSAPPRPVVVNVFASWCVPCLVEHPQMTELARAGAALVGINYKDKAEEARTWLTRHGDPYAAIGFDLDGRAGIEWGITGVPETFVVDKGGIVRWRFQGPVTREVLRDALNPLLRSLA